MKLMRLIKLMGVIFYTLPHCCELIFILTRFILKN